MGSDGKGGEIVNNRCNIQKDSSVFRHRLTVQDLESYRKKLRPGQIKRIRVYETPEGHNKKTVQSMIEAVYRHTVLVRYRIDVSIFGVKTGRKAERLEAVRIADLMIWEMTGIQEE